MNKKCLLAIAFICLSIFGISSSSQELNHHKPHMQAEFVGRIAKNGNAVIMDPPLFASDQDAPQLSGLICEYKLHNIGGSVEEIPFFVSVTDKRSGSGAVILKSAYKLIDCGLVKEYVLYITAYDCGIGKDQHGNIIGQRHSHKSKVHITVMDINQCDPYFPTSNFIFEVEENIRSGQTLLELDAVDDDCSHDYGNICEYLLSGDDAGLFEVTSTGLLVSKQKLTVSDEDKFINVSVVAVDCAGRKSKPASIAIKLKPACLPGWSGIVKHVDMVSTQYKSVRVFSDPVLLPCMSSSDITSVDVTVRLDMNQVHEITGCDRDTYRLQDARRLCDAEEEDMLDLLPTYSQYNELVINSDPDIPPPPTLKREAGNKMYEFDGDEQALEVSDAQLYNMLNQLNLTSTFSISFRMFLNGNTNDTTSSKSTIICKSDESGLSRHHFSVYVQNCHVMLLLRTEHGKRRSLNPAEWHWKLEKNDECAGKWYRILINVDFPNSALFVDGKERVPYLVADDYPIRETRRSAKWAIGAAWEGRSSEFIQHFRGKLSELVVYVGVLEDVEVLSCVDQCKEGLLLQGVKDEEFNGTAVNNNEMSLADTNITLSLTSAKSDLETLLTQLRNIVYFNSRRFPASGERKVRLTTRLHCSPTSSKCSYIPPVDMYVMVIPPPDPIITISGKGFLTLRVDDISNRGFHFFDDLSIVSKSLSIVTSEKHEDGLPSQHNLDSCVIREMGESNHAGKFKIRSKTLVENGKLILERNENGIALRGIQELSVYQQVLRSMTYHNGQGYNVAKLVFAIACSELNGRYHSNTYQLEVKLIHPSPHLVAAQIPPFKPASIRGQPLPAGLVAFDDAGGGNPDMFGEDIVMLDDEEFQSHVSLPAIIIGSCVAAMVLLVVAALVQFKLQGCDPSLDEETVDIVMNEDVEKDVKEEDLDWDDSAMVITVNPMESELEAGESECDISDLEEDLPCDHRRNRETSHCSRQSRDLNDRDGNHIDEYYEWDQ